MNVKNTSHINIDHWGLKLSRWLLLMIAFVRQKIESKHFRSCPASKTLPQEEGNYWVPPGSIFLWKCIVSERLSQLYIDNLIRFWGLAYGKVFYTNIDVQGISGLILYSFLFTFRWLAGAWARQVLPYRFKFIMECSVVSFIEKYVTII